MFQVLACTVIKMTKYESGEASFGLVLERRKRRSQATLINHALGKGFGN
jgi:hypothetical protein